MLACCSESGNFECVKLKASIQFEHILYFCLQISAIQHPGMSQINLHIKRLYYYAIFRIVYTVRPSVVLYIPGHIGSMEIHM